MNDVRRRLRAVIEHALPYFDRPTEERWKIGFQRDLAAAKAVRQHADAEIAHDVSRETQMRGSFARADKRLAGQ